MVLADWFLRHRILSLHFSLVLGLMYDSKVYGITMIGWEFGEAESEHLGGLVGRSKLLDVWYQHDMLVRCCGKKEGVSAVVRFLWAISCARCYHT